MVVKPRSANIEDIAVILHVNQTDDELENYSYNYPLSELRSQDEEETNTRGVGATREAEDGGSRRMNLLVVDWCRDCTV